MKRTFFAVFFIIVSIFTAIPALSATDNVRVRTFFAMEPYGRMSVTNWGAPDAVVLWNATYGFTPGLEIYGVLSERVELGAGFRYQIGRRVLRSGGSDDEKFSYIPIYVAGRFDIVESYGINMYGIVKLGYSILTGNQAFHDIWMDEPSDGNSLDSTAGGFYAGGALGVVFTILQRENWGLDWSMDAGYAFHGGSGRKTSSGKGYKINYQKYSR